MSTTTNSDQLARARRLLVKIGEAAQRGPLDLDTMDEIARNSLAALRALDEAEGKGLSEEFERRAA